MDTALASKGIEVRTVDTQQLNQFNNETQDFT